MKRRKLKYCFGQSTMEYAVLLALVAAAIVGMQIYVRRGIQGRIKNLANEISPEHYEAGTTISNSTTIQSGRTVSKYEDGATTASQNETVTRTSEEGSIYEESK